MTGSECYWCAENNGIWCKLCQKSFCEQDHKEETFVCPTFEELGKMTRHERFTVMVDGMEHRLSLMKQKYRENYNFENSSYDQTHLSGKITSLERSLTWVQSFWVVLK